MTREPPRGQPLAAVLMALTFVTGLLDAVTYLSLGHVFAANQTGNIIVLGFALVETPDISVAASVASLVCFGAGAAFSTWAARVVVVGRWARLHVVMLALEAGLLALAALTSALPEIASHTPLTVAMLALAMGMRTVTIQRMGVTTSTTVLTVAVATLASNSVPPHINWTEVRPRAAAIAALLLGAASGAVMLRLGPPILALVLAAGLTVLATVGVAVPLGRLRIGAAGVVMRSPP